MTESIILRTLTIKSVLWFGKHKGLKVQQIIDIRCQTYLRWIYYNYSGITFTESILKELTIVGKRKIKKPGIAPDMHFEIIEENRKGLHIHTKSHMDKIIKIRTKCKLVSINKSVNFSKSQMQAINQGRM